MTKSTSVNLVLEWSPKGITAYDALTAKRVELADGEAIPFRGREALLAVSRRAVFVRTARVPNTSIEEVRLILRSRLGDLFPIPATDLAFDVALTNDMNAEGRLAIIAAMSASDLRLALQAMTNAGVKIVKTVPVAWGSALLSERLALPDSAVVSTEREATNIDLIAGGLLRGSRVAPLTGDLDREVARSFSIAGVDVLPTLAVGGTHLPKADNRTNTGALEELANAPLDKLLVNLQPPEAIANQLNRETNQRRRLVYLLAAASALLAITIGLDRSDAAAAASKAENKLNGQLKTLKAKQTTAEGAVAKEIELQRLLNLGFRPAQRISDMATLAVNGIPDGTWLTGITVERGKPMLVRGTAKTNEGVSQFLKTLGAAPRFRDVKLVFANNSEIDKTPVIQFSASLFPIGNLPLIEQIKKGGAKPPVPKVASL